jgi:hypothetical protein
MSGSPGSSAGSVAQRDVPAEARREHVDRQLVAGTAEREAEFDVATRLQAERRVADLVSRGGQVQAVGIQLVVGRRTLRAAHLPQRLPAAAEFDARAE